MIPKQTNKSKIIMYLNLLHSCTKTGALPVFGVLLIQLYRALLTKSEHKFYSKNILSKTCKQTLSDR